MRSFERGSGVYNTDEYWQQIQQLGQNGRDWLTAGEKAKRTRALGAEAVQAVEQAQEQTKHEGRMQTETEEQPEGAAPTAETTDEVAEEAVVETEVEEVSEKATKEPKTEVEAEPEVIQGKAQLEAWQETMAGTPEERWQALEDEYAERKGVEMEAYAQPQIEMLRQKAEEVVRQQLPEMGEAGVAARVDLALKVALGDLAEEEARLLASAEVGRNGQRKLQKGWDEALLHQIYYDMRNNLLNVYGAYDWMEVDAQSDELGEDELVAWRALDAPRTPGTLSMRYLLGKYPRREDEGADAYFERLQAYTRQDQRRKKQLKADAKYEAAHPKQHAEVVPRVEAEVVYAPKPLVTMETESQPQAAEAEEQTHVNLATRVWQKVKRAVPFTKRKAQVLAKAELVPVIAGDEIIDLEPETGTGEVPEQDGREAVGQVISTVERAIQAVEHDTSFLEDYDEKKSDLLQNLDEAKILLLNIQADLEAASEDIKAGQQQRKQGLVLDKIEVGESEALRRGEFALEELYTQGVLERDQPLEVQLEFLQSLQTQASEKVKTAAADEERARRELAKRGDTASAEEKERLRDLAQEATLQRWVCNELLDKTLPAVRLLKYMEGNQETADDDEVIVDFPSEDALRRVDR